MERGEDANRNGTLDAGEDANNNGVLDGEFPGVADADQVVWYVCNDIGVAQPWTCPETGMEEQTTIWGYARTDPLGNVIFKRFKLVYKGVASTPANARIDSMYMSQWSDPDLGASGDDFAGCDRSLSLGYVYNANPRDSNYDQFGLVPPASGYDFLQGPLVRGVVGEDRNANGVDDGVDFGIFDLKRVGPGFINLPLTAFIYFAAGGRYSDPPFSYSGAIQWYQMLRGLPPTPQGPPDPPAVVNPVTGQPSNFWLDGDPVNRTGWIDGSLDNPGDRRIILASGPFTMAVGDSQELVSAYVGGLGSTNLGSITVMKFNDRSVQLAYDNLFDLPKAPAPPKVFASALDGAVLLDWGYYLPEVAKTETTVYIGGYGFEGYKVYQLPDASGDLSNAKLIFKCDLINGVKTINQETLDPISGEIVVQPVQYGTDNGISRNLTVTRDEIRGRPLVNGQRYYFAVTAYNYTPDVNKPIRSLESPTSGNVLIVIPETPKPGTRYPYGIGDTVFVSGFSGNNDAPIYAEVYDPARTNGEQYRIRFDTVSAGTFNWTLTKTSTSEVLYSNITNFSDTLGWTVPEAGVKFYVALPPIGMRTVATGGQNSFIPAQVNGYGIANVVGLNGTNGLNGLGNTNRDYELRFDGVGGWAVRYAGSAPGNQRVTRVPFSAWDVGREPSDTPVRVVPAFRDTIDPNTAPLWNIRPVPLTINGVEYRVWDPIAITSFVYPNTGTEAGDSLALFAQRIQIAAAAQTQQNVRNAVFNASLADVNQTGQPPANQVFKFTKYHELRAGDTKTFQPAAVVTGDNTLAAGDVSAIKVFPNPYYGVNRAETAREVKYVTFSHLPTRAVIRIFNLAGVLVRTIQKEDASQFLQWDLQNDNGLPVASGIYIAYIDMPEIGATKTVKLAVIMEQQFLRFY
jgi:hypothetical protein